MKMFVATVVAVLLFAILLKVQWPVSNEFIWLGCCIIASSFSDEGEK